MSDHSGNGKIERLIKTINERLRANKQRRLTKDKSGLSEVLYALGVSKKKEDIFPFEKHMGKEPNAAKSNLVGKFMDISEQDSKLEFQPSDFQDETEQPFLSENDQKAQSWSLRLPKRREQS